MRTGEKKLMSDIARVSKNMMDGIATEANLVVEIEAIRLQTNKMVRMVRDAVDPDSPLEVKVSLSGVTGQVEIHIKATPKVIAELRSVSMGTPNLG